MSKLSFFVRLAISIGLLHATPIAEAQGRPACAKRDLVVQRLEERFGETLRSMGLNQNEGLVEVFASEATGTWTILMTMPDGVSCLLAAGRMWEDGSSPATIPGKDI